MFDKKMPLLFATLAVAGSLFVGANAVQAQEVTEEIPEKIYDLRGDNGIFDDFRPTGVSFIGADRLMICDSNELRLHIFDTQGRRFKRLNVPRELPIPNYSALARLSKDNYLAIGNHYQENNNVRLLDAHSVMHLYTLRGEVLTGESANKNYDPITALRKTGFLGQYVERQMEVSGLAVSPETNKMYIALSRPIEEDGSIIIYEANLEEVLACDKRTKFTQHNYGIFPRIDETAEQYYRVTDICHVADKGLLLLLAAAKSNGYAFGSNQLWFKPEGSEEAYLLAEDIAPGNYGAGIDSRAKGDGTYDIVITFDNNPVKTSTPSRLMMLENVSL